uniref:Terpene synthase metal-binding domain-containing protein n=1 Tax=Chenopodium quinoa TaxID=63459 RepID=A0A803L3D4_CHEQI
MIHMTHMFEELECLTDAFERWDLSSMEKFPANYMKVMYEFVINTLDDVAKEMTSIGKPYAGIFAREQLMQYNTTTMATANIGRLMDDMTTCEAELARGVRLASSVECYMKDYNTS